MMEIVDGVESLQYKIALAVAQMQDGPLGNVPTAERLQVLEKYQRAWANVDVSTEADISIVPQMDDDDLSNEAVIEGSVFAQRGLGLTAVDFVQLPSKIRRIEESRWSIDDATLGFQPIIYTSDPAQDLLVAVALERYALDRSFKLPTSR